MENAENEQKEKKPKLDGDELLGKIGDMVDGGVKFKEVAGPLNQFEKRVLKRAIGQTWEEFSEKLAIQIQKATIDAVDRLQDAINKNKIPPQNLPFAVAMLTDKALALQSKTAIKSASVNVQINNYGEATKEELIARLLKLSKPKEKKVESIKPEQEQPPAG